MAAQPSVTECFVERSHYAAVLVGTWVSDGERISNGSVCAQPNACKDAMCD